jgi:hypothetical protein
MTDQKPRSVKLIYEIDDGTLSIVSDAGDTIELRDLDPVDCMMWRIFFQKLDIKVEIKDNY